MEDYQLKKMELKQWLQRINRRNIIIHFVFQRGVFYPVNRLRNVAQDNCGSAYILTVDVDFLPSMHMYQSLIKLIKTGYFDTTENKAAVVPAFEMVNNHSLEVPESKEDIRRLYKTKEVLPFHFKQYKPGHAPTLSEKWMTSNKPYQVKHKNDYEPYVLLKKDVSPAYDERFLQRFLNKVVHIEELHRRGFQFWVIPDVFVIHFPHPSLLEDSRKIKGCVSKYWKHGRTGKKKH